MTSGRLPAAARSLHGAARRSHGSTATTAAPDAASAALLRHLELKVVNKLDGLLQGNYLGLVPGAGTEAGESRLYFPGDDVRRIDWPVTARTTVPHVRQTVADRELETWLAVDLSASLDFGTALSEKRELVLAALTALTQLTVRYGNRIGALATNGEIDLRVPALTGMTHARRLVRTMAQIPRAEVGHGADLNGLLDQLSRPQRRRGLVVVISDFISAVRDDPHAHSSGRSRRVAAAPMVSAPVAPTWFRTLRALGARHQLLAIEIIDPRELELEDSGLTTFTDTETGAEIEVQTSDAAVRSRFAEAAQAQRDEVATHLRRAGASHLILRTDRDWIDDIVRFVLTRRHQLMATGSH